MLIIFAGLPGVGKTSLASELSLRIGASYIRIDSIEQAISNSSLKVNEAENAGYLAGYAVAGDNLKLGRIVIADSVNPIELTREAWVNIAKTNGVPSIEVEVICSDKAEHRRRVETRKSDISGLIPPSWKSVEGREYHGWKRNHIVIDTANKSIQETVQELIHQLPVK